MGVKDFSLKREASRNENYLNSITILDAQATVSKGEPNGDSITGSSSPARAEFTVDTTFGELYDEVVTNLGEQGYVIEEKFDTVGEATNTDVIMARFTASKENKYIVFRIYLSEKISCRNKRDEPIGEPCYYKRPVTPQTSGLFDKSVIKLAVSYDDDEIPIYR